MRLLDLGEIRAPVGAAEVARARPHPSDEVDAAVRLRQLPPDVEQTRARLRVAAAHLRRRHVDV